MPLYKGPGARGPLCRPHLASFLLHCILTPTKQYASRTDQNFTALRRRKYCEDELGEGIVALHKAAYASEGSQAAFWRRLRGHAETLDEVFWWRGGSQALKQSVDMVGLCP